MNLIDAHVHFSNIAVFADTARLYAGVDYSAAGLMAECAACGLHRVVGMGVTETARYAFPDENAPVPMGCDLPDAPPLLAVCPGINPYGLTPRSLSQLGQALRSGQAAGIKIYAGYYPFTPDDPVYEPVYQLAEAYHKPVVIHSGDTFSERGLLEYARPLHVDRLAVRKRDVNFVIAHLGDPWILEACEVAYKNKNVFLDLSGLVVGGADEVARVRGETLLFQRFQQGLLFLNDYQKILYGSDWPLVPMKPYMDFCRALVPEAFWPDVFGANAEKVFQF